jgi:hypothetical protein
MSFAMRLPLVTVRRFRLLSGLFHQIRAPIILGWPCLDFAVCQKSTLLRVSP